MLRRFVRECMTSPTNLLLGSAAVGGAAALLWTGAEEAAAFLLRHSGSAFASTSTPAWHRASPAWHHPSPAWPATNLGHQFLADPGMWRGRGEETPWDHACGGDAPCPDDGLPHLIPQPLIRTQNPHSGARSQGFREAAGYSCAALGPPEGLLPPLLSSSEGQSEGHSEGSLWPAGSGERAWAGVRLEQV